IGLLVVDEAAHRRGPGDGALGDLAQLFGLGVGGRDALVLDQRRDQVGQQRVPRPRLARELSTRFLMAHFRNPLMQASCAYALPRIVGGTQPSSFMPRLSPISARISLISLSDLRPKFLVLSISASVFCTSSPM